MQYRRLGRTGLRASEMGFGAWAIARNNAAASDGILFTAEEAARARAVLAGT